MPSFPESRSPAFLIDINGIKGLYLKHVVIRGIDSGDYKGDSSRATRVPRPADSIHHSKNNVNPFFIIFFGFLIITPFCGDGNHFEDKNKGEDTAVMAANENGISAVSDRQDNGNSSSAQ